MEIVKEMQVHCYVTQKLKKRFGIIGLVILVGGAMLLGVAHIASSMGPVTITIGGVGAMLIGVAILILLIRVLLPGVPISWLFEMNGQSADKKASSDFDGETDL